MPSGGFLQEYWAHAGTVTAIVFSPDGQYFVSGSTDNSIILWDIISNTRPKLQFQIEFPQSTVTNLSLPDKATRKQYLREEGRNYREIATALGIHWARVWQILRNR